MTCVLVIAFDAQDTARNVWTTMRRVSDGSEQAMFTNVAIVARDQQGMLFVNTDEQPERFDTANVGILPLLARALFTSAADLLLGKTGTSQRLQLADLELDDEFVQAVLSAIRSDTSAILALVNDQHFDAALASLQAYGGTCYTTVLASNTEQLLRNLDNL